MAEAIEAEACGGRGEGEEADTRAGGQRDPLCGSSPSSGGGDSNDVYVPRCILVTGGAGFM